MKLSIPKKELVESLESVCKFLGRGTMMEITKNILVEVFEREVIFNATDLAVACRSRCNANVTSEGAAVVPGTKLLSLVKSFTKDEIHLTLTENKRLNVTDTPNKKTNQFFVACINPDKFPTIPLPAESSKKVAIHKSEFLDKIGRVDFAADKKSEDYTSMIFLEENMVFATNKQKFAILKDSNNFSLKLPKTALKYFKLLASEFELIIEDDAFYLQDEKTFILIKTHKAIPPSSQIQTILSRDVEEVAVYQFDKDDIKQWTKQLNQISILHSLVTFFLTKECIWMAGSDDNESVDFSLKKIDKEGSNEDFLVTFDIKFIKDSLREVDEAKVIFTKGSPPLLKIIERDFQAFFPPRICNEEQKIFNLIGGDING